MKMAILYFSKHKGNTKKLITKASKNLDIDLIDGHLLENTNFSNYDILGIASGIYNGTMDEKLIALVKDNKIILPKKIFLISTSGMPFKKYHNEIKQIINDKNIEIIDEFLCKGYDSAGIFKFFGGISKNRPNREDIESFRNLIINIQKNF